MTNWSSVLEEGWLTLQSRVLTSSSCTSACSWSSARGAMCMNRLPLRSIHTESESKRKRTHHAFLGCSATTSPEADLLLGWQRTLGHLKLPDLALNVSNEWRNQRETFQVVERTNAGQMVWLRFRSVASIEKQVESGDLMAVCPPEGNHERMYSLSMFEDQNTGMCVRIKRGGKCSTWLDSLEVGNMIDARILKNPHGSRHRNDVSREPQRGFPSRSFRRPMAIGLLLTFTPSSRSRACPTTLWSDGCNLGCSNWCSWCTKIPW